MKHHLTPTGFLLTMHPQAPLYESENPDTLFEQVLNEKSGTEGVREVLRQTALVSLWFFEKFVLGYNGPFNEIDNGLHLDMANFRQTCLEPGSRFAMFTGRSFFKTTVGTTGADVWEIVRWPDICIGLFHGVVEKAMIMLATMQQPFYGNEFFQWLFPEHAVANPRTQPRFNAHELVTPARTRHFPEASVMVGGATGSNQSLHFDLFDVDDLVGDEDLDANRSSTVDMDRKRNWFRANREALLKPGMGSRVGVKATRYAPDDPYEDIMLDVKEEHGYWKELDADYRARPDGHWKVYYRQALENDESVIPKIKTTEELLRIQKEDPWTFSTWYMNNPRRSGVTEFTSLKVRTFELVLEGDEWWIELKSGERRAITGMDFVIGGDPAGSEKRVDARTSRSADACVLQDHTTTFYVLGGHVDYVPITTFFDWIFEDWYKWRKYVRLVVPEAQGGFKIIEPLIRKEKRERKMEAMPHLCKPKTGDKEAAIRVALLPILKDGRLFCEQGFMPKLMQEVNGFPGSRKNDLLDAVRIAVEASIRPTDPEEELDALERETKFSQRTTNVTGY